MGKFHTRKITYDSKAPVYLRLDNKDGYDLAVNYLTWDEAEELRDALSGILEYKPKVPTPREIWRKRLDDSPIGTVIRNGDSDFIKVDDNLWHSRKTGAHFETYKFDEYEDQHGYYTFI